MRFPDSSHWSRKCQISHVTWKCNTQLPLHHWAPPSVLLPTATFISQRHIKETKRGKAAAWQSDGEREQTSLGVLHFWLGSLSKFILHAEAFPRQHTHAPPPPAKPQKRFFWRSRGYDTQLRSKATEDSELYSTAKKLGRGTKAERRPRRLAEQSWSIACKGWEDKQREGGTSRQTHVTHTDRIHAS